MQIFAPPLAFPTNSFPGASTAGTPSGIVGELVLSEVLGRYATLVKKGLVHSAYATVTTPAAFSATVGIGGPLLWNPPNSKIDGHILAVSAAVATANTVAGSLGIAGNGGQPAQPTTTTVIDASGNALMGGTAAAIQAFRLGTVAVASPSFMPVLETGTGAVTVVDAQPAWIDLGGLFNCPPGSWLAVAGSAALTNGVFQVGIMWAELPT